MLTRTQVRKNSRKNTQRPRQRARRRPYAPGLRRSVEASSKVRALCPAERAR